MCRRCGCQREAHEHYRGPADIMVAECSLCGNCTQYQPPRKGWLSSLRV